MDDVAEIKEQLANEFRINGQLQEENDRLRNALASLRDDVEEYWRSVTAAWEEIDNLKIERREES